MVLPLLVALVGQSQDKGPVELKSRIVEASVFKSGLVMLTREVTVPAGSGRYRLDVLPPALDGTFWYGSPDELKVSDLTTVFRITEKKEKVVSGSLTELLFNNIGKHVTLVERQTYPPGPTRKVSGTIVKTSGAPYNASLLMKLDDGGFHTPSVTEILEVHGKDLTYESSRTVKSPQIRIQFSATSAKPAKLQVITLETGAAWVGSYLVKLGKDRSAEVQGKAQLAVGGLKFQATRVQALAGEPTLPTTPKFDLAAGYGSLMAYLSGSQDRYREFRQDTVDPYTLLAAFRQNGQNNFGGQAAYIGNGYDNFGGAGGGMGGGGFAGLPPGAPRMDENTDLRNLPNQANAERLEGLFSYPMGNLDMEPGDRITRLLFSQQAPYATLYKWRADPGNSVVTNTLRITNGSKVPWTGGPVLIIKDGKPLAQLPMPFTAIGNAADLDLGVAKDVLVSREDRQIRLEDHASLDFPHAVLKRSIQEFRLVVENTRDEETPMEISTSVAGDVMEPAGGSVVQLALRADTFNWQRAITWNLKLKPMERREIVVTYAQVIQTGIR